MIKQCFCPMKWKISRQVNLKDWVFNYAKLTIGNDPFNLTESWREDVQHLSRDLMDIYQWAHFRIKIVSANSTRKRCSVITSELMTILKMDMEWSLYAELKTTQAATGRMIGIYDSCLQCIVKSHRVYDEKVCRIGKRGNMKKKYADDIEHSTYAGCVYILILNRMRVTGGCGETQSMLLVSKNDQEYIYCRLGLSLIVYILSLLPVN